MSKISVYKGDTKTITITVKDTDNDPQNISGYTITLTVKKSETDADADAVLQKQFTALEQSLYPGQAQVTLTPSDTDLTARTYVYDIELDSASPLLRKTLVKGFFEVIQDVYHHD